MYLLDTNICIYIINKHPEQVVKKIKKLKTSQVKLSAISLGELEYGVSKSMHREQNRNAMMNFVSAFDIVDFDDADAEVYGLIRADLKRKGQIRGAYDMQIAAQAITRDLILVTNNTNEFSRVLNLKLENWV
jgi:tRNA(fMet)-specific endonuclease VapC